MRPPCIFTLACVLAALAGPSAALAAPGGLAGTWQAKSHCASVANGGESACTTPGEDFFALRLFVANGVICGRHSAVSAGGNHVDEIPGHRPSIEGTGTASRADVTFTSASGGTGRATLALRGSKLLWRITSASGEHWLPEQAALRRVRSGAWGAETTCGAARHGL